MTTTSEKRGIQWLEQQAGVFSYNLINHVLDTAAANSNISDKSKLYDILKKTWLKNLQANVSIPMPLMPSNVSNDNKDIRLSTQLPIVPRLKGLEGCPTPKIEFQSMETTAVKEYFVLKNGEHQDITHEETGPVQLIKNKKRKKNEQDETKRNDPPDDQIVETSSKPGIKTDIIIGTLVQVNPSISSSIGDQENPPWIKGRIVQIYRKKTSMRNVKTSIKVRLREGEELIAPWPNANIKLGTHHNDLFSTDISAIALDEELFPANTLQSYPSILDELFLDDILDNEDEEEDDEYSALPVISLSSKPSIPSSSSSSEHQPSGQSTQPPPTNHSSSHHQYISLFPPSSTQDNLCVLATGENISKESYDEIESYYEQLKTKSIRWILKQEITTSTPLPGNLPMLSMYSSNKIICD